MNASLVSDLIPNLTSGLIPKVFDLSPIYINEVYNLFIFYSLTYFLTKFFNKGAVWDISTRITSTYNALQCVYVVIPLILSGQLDKYNILSARGEENVVNMLYRFAAYLTVDGIFLNWSNLSNTMSIIHHVVGGVGIYLIAYKNLGLGLGIYFAWTEISTPLLNIAYVLHKSEIKTKLTYIIFGMFYLVFTIARILTIPLLIKYLVINKDIIANLQLIEYIMTYGGSGSLIVLNIIWFIMITKKIMNK